MFDTSSTSCDTVGSRDDEELAHQLCTPLELSPSIARKERGVELNPELASNLDNLIQLDIRSLTQQIEVLRNSPIINRLCKSVNSPGIESQSRKVPDHSTTSLSNKNENGSENNNNNSQQPIFKPPLGSETANCSKPSSKSGSSGCCNLLNQEQPVACGGLTNPQSPPNSTQPVNDTNGVPKSLQEPRCSKVLPNYQNELHSLQQQIANHVCGLEELLRDAEGALNTLNKHIELLDANFSRQITGGKAYSPNSIFNCTLILVAVGLLFYILFILCTACPTVQSFQELHR